MKKLVLVKKRIAFCMLVILTANLCLPCFVYALTSGPVQPEMKGFEPAGTTNLVDPFTGDLTYNIPLLDVGGYPVNIAYHSGSGMDDEASWVGFGWSLSPGVIDRQMRGLPDDFNGKGTNGDKIEKVFHMRNDITGGVDLNFAPEVFGFDVGKAVNVGVQAGIFYNNKRGLGIQFGLNANAPLLSNGKANAGTNTAGLSGGASLSFNSQNGASFNPNINFSITAKQLGQTESNTALLSLGGSFQSRAGLQAITLAETFRNENIYKETKNESFSRSFGGELASSSVSYAAQSFLPETQADYFNESYSVAPQFGPEAWGFFAGLQLTGHYSLQKVANPVTRYNAYGFMHGHDAKDDANGLMDFNREKDVPYFDGVPNLPVPVATPDLFMVHAQDGSSQYRAYLGGTGIFSDHDAVNTGISASIGVEVGAGAGFKIGADLQASIGKTFTGKWKTGNRTFLQDKNEYDSYGNFTGPGEGTDAAYEPVYFKKAGEQVSADGSIFDKVKGTVPIRVKTSGSITGATAANILSAKDNSETVVTRKIIRDNRDVRNNTFNYLTNNQVQTAGLEKKTIDYFTAAGGFKPFLDKCAGNTTAVQQYPYRKPHHIGEITITDESGARKIYGIPAYNIYQEDVSFSIPKNNNAEDRNKGLVNYNSKDASVDNNNGTDHFFSKEIIPGYAHSFLLTGILSADYIDLKDDGITDDDPGTAVKFNYWRKSAGFQWRTPYAAGKANYNEGLQSDPMDDRGNYSYGKKELWYLHSIESKTMVAVFETANREDALGADAAGNADNAPDNRQQYLKTITLYAKSDWQKNQQQAIPLKTVHFIYDYSLFGDENNVVTGAPNNTKIAATGANIIANQGGKLTLKKIFFTYQDNNKGELQPYQFTYNFNKRYEWKQYDRWGNYKNKDADNPAAQKNDYYPYSTQNKVAADANAALWQLTAISTPAGGKISIQYESDDYLYVQNRKAMEMYPMAGIGSTVHQTDKYYDGDKIFVQLPEALPSDEALRSIYFDGGNNANTRNLFFKTLVQLTNGKDLQDYVAGYAEIENIRTDVKLAAGHPDIAEIKVKKIKGEGVTTAFHPVAKAAWQFMRLNTPALVYPGYNVREDLGPVQFVNALVGAISSIAELLAPFDTRAQLKKLAASIDLSRSFVRLEASTNKTKKINNNAYYAKLGGGARVKEVGMSDEWSSMAGPGAQTAAYGLLYDYTTTIQQADGKEVTASSGVASYEPMIGNEENPFHQPTAYQQKIKLGPDNTFFIDDPLCESWFPAAGVGYSKVTIRKRGADGQIGATGYTINEFYTQKDFPTGVSHTPVDVQQFGGAGILQLLHIKKNNSRVVSQGFTIELNDMHGKPKSEKVIDKGGNEISAVYYHYKTVNDNDAEKKLSNQASVLQSNGTVSSAVIGRDIEMYTDMRSQTSFTAGVNVMVNVDAIYLLFAIIPVPVVLPLPNAEYTGFRSAATIKVIQQFGILDKIVKRQNGAQVTSENIAWDAGTGAVLLTRTQNEFDDPLYTLSYPAHWIYETGMGQAYKNLGLVITGFSAAAGNIAASVANSWLVSGDELLVTNSLGESKKYWINKTGSPSLLRQVLIDAAGIPATVSGTACVVRSGRRNMHSIEMGKLVSMENPVKNGNLDITVFTRVLDASASVYNDEWAIEARNIVQLVQACPPGYLSDATGRCYKDTVINTEPQYAINTTVVKQKNNLYSTCGTFLNNIPGSYLTGGAGDPPGSGKITLNTPGTWQNGTVTCGTGGVADDDGPLNRSGIWLAERNNNNYLNQWVGIKSKFYLDKVNVKNRSADGKTGYLFIGFGSLHSIEIRIDNVIVAAHNRNNDNNSTSSMRTWRIKPVAITLDQQHEIFIRVKNEVARSEAVMGVELYDNSFNELSAATCIHAVCLPCNFCAACRNAGSAAVNENCGTGVSANTIWSTNCVLGKRFNYHSTAAGAVLTDFDPVCSGTLFTDDNCNLSCRVVQRNYVSKVITSACTPPVGQIINPYTTGLRGNWRLQQSFAYHTDRDSKLPYIKPGEPDPLEKTDIRKSGAFIQFTPFWSLTNNAWLGQPDVTGKDAAWVKSNQITVFNQKGSEIENEDVLNRFSAAQFGYQQSMVTAVASNARYTDIGYDGFEDYDFHTDDCNDSDTCNLDGHFSIKKLTLLFPVSFSTDGLYAHTGRNSLKIAAASVPAEIIKPVLPVTTGARYAFSGNSMHLNANGILKGFTPQPGKQYMLSVWIKDNGSNVQLGPQSDMGKAAVDILTGGQLFTTIKAGPAIEGWRKTEVVFMVPLTATDLKIQFRPGAATAWFDDIRIHPYNAQVKTYAYDNRSLRLWAELDENNFATFFEYDDEGKPVRVKKETEKGIMTIKESRSTYKIKR